MPRLGIVIASVREGRVGIAVANWFIEVARSHGGFDVEVLDLKAINLPLFSERTHPRLHQYESEQQKAWGATIAALDAFVFVTPEYNYSPSPALLNALDYLYVEWHHKPAAFVSYGGISGGLRAAQVTKLTLGALKIVPIDNAVVVPFVARTLDPQTKQFKATEDHNKAARGLLDELLRYATALAPLRQ